MKNKENYFGCLIFIVCVILGIGWFVSSSNKNKEIKLLNTKIGIKDEIIKNLENKAEKESESEAKNNQKLQLPAYVYLDRDNCIHMFFTCYHITPQESRRIKNNYDEVNINISNETMPSHNYAIKRLKIGETDFSKYEWYCSECVLDDYYDLLQTKGEKKPNPMASKEDFSQYKRKK